MTDVFMQSFSGNPQILPKRLGEFLRRRGSAKQLALDLEIDLRTMENLRGGRTWPIARHFWNIWVEFGDEVIEAVFSPEKVEARLQRETELREQAKRARAAAAQVEDRSFRVAPGLAEGAGSDEEPVGPPNLDLFEARP